MTAIDVAARLCVALTVSQLGCVSRPKAGPVMTSDKNEIVRFFEGTWHVVAFGIAENSPSITEDYTEYLVPTGPDTIQIFATGVPNAQNRSKPMTFHFDGDKVELIQQAMKMQGRRTNNTYVFEGHARGEKYVYRLFLMGEKFVFNVETWRNGVCTSVYNAHGTKITEKKSN